MTASTVHGTSVRPTDHSSDHPKVSLKTGHVDRQHGSDGLVGWFIPCHAGLTKAEGMGSMWFSSITPHLQPLKTWYILLRRKKSTKDRLMVGGWFWDEIVRPVFFRDGIGFLAKGSPVSQQPGFHRATLDKGFLLPKPDGQWFFKQVPRVQTMWMNE